MEPIFSIGVEESEAMQTSVSKVLYFGLEFFFERFVRGPPRLKGYINRFSPSSL
jgi:hypothetical protein